MDGLRGGAVSRALLPIGPLDAGAARWSGFLPGRHLTRSSRQHITLLVNGRCVHSRSIQAAMAACARPTAACRSAYHGGSPPGRRPASCNGSPDGSVTVTVSGGTAPYSVAVNGVVVSDWSYDAAANRIVFAQGDVPAPGAHVTAKYEAACP